MMLEEKEQIQQRSASMSDMFTAIISSTHGTGDSGSTRDNGSTTDSGSPSTDTGKVGRVEGKDGVTDAEEVMRALDDAYSTGWRYFFTQPDVYLALGFKRPPAMCHSDHSDYKLTVLDD
jgi:hypothetical protein